MGDLAHPLYVFIQLFVFYQNPCSILHNFPVKKTCAFSVPLICSSVCGQMCSHVCVYMTTRAYIDLHSVQLVAHFVCLGSILSVQCAHLCTCQKCIFVHIVHPPCEFANIVLFCTFCDQFATVCVSVQWQWILCTPSPAAREEVRVYFWNLAPHNK